MHALEQHVGAGYYCVQRGARLGQVRDWKSAIQWHQDYFQELQKHQGTKPGV